MKYSKLFIVLILSFVFIMSSVIVTFADTQITTNEVIPINVKKIVNFDELYTDEEQVVVEESMPVVIEEEETPLADALPQTGQLPVELFYGIGGLVSTIGIYIKRKR